MIVQLYIGKGERTEYKDYGSIILLSMVGKKYARILADRVYKVIEGSIKDEQRGFRSSGRGCVDQMFTLKQIKLVRKHRRSEGFI